MILSPLLEILGLQIDLNNIGFNFNVKHTFNSIIDFIKKQQY